MHCRERRTVLAAVKATPRSGAAILRQALRRPALTSAARRALRWGKAGMKERLQAEQKN
jgi:hypothetical protein